MGRHRDDEGQNGVSVAELIGKVMPEEYAGTHRRDTLESTLEAEVASLSR